MILEVAVLNVKSEQAHEFEIAFNAAQSIIMSMKGYISHQLYKCIEKEFQYLLLVHWQKLEDHTVGFRCSPEYDQWKQLLHHFYEPFPSVEHYKALD